MREISFNLGVPVDEADNILWAEATLPIYQSDLGCAVEFCKALYEIEEISKDGKIVGLYPLNGEAVILNEIIDGFISVDGTVYDFLVRDSNKMRRLIEDGETHAEYKARKFNIKIVIRQQFLEQKCRNIYNLIQTND